jgi:hypothetical protein
MARFGRQAIALRWDRYHNGIALASLRLIEALDRRPDEARCVNPTLWMAMLSTDKGLNLRQIKLSHRKMPLGVGKHSGKVNPVLCRQSQLQHGAVVRDAPLDKDRFFRLQGYFPGIVVSSGAVCLAIPGTSGRLAGSVVRLHWGHIRSSLSSGLTMASAPPYPLPEILQP